MIIQRFCLSPFSLLPIFGFFCFQKSTVVRLTNIGIVFTCNTTIGLYKEFMHSGGVDNLGRDNIHICVIRAGIRKNNV